MQVSYNPVFQVYNDLETLLHASTGEQITEFQVPIYSV